MSQFTGVFPHNCIDIFFFLQTLTEVSSFSCCCCRFIMCYYKLFVVWHLGPKCYPGHLPFFLFNRSSTFSFTQPGLMQNKLQSGPFLQFRLSFQCWLRFSKCRRLFHLEIRLKLLLLLVLFPPGHIWHTENSCVYLIHYLLVAIAAHQSLLSVHLFWALFDLLFYYPPW